MRRTIRFVAIFVLITLGAAVVFSVTKAQTADGQQQEKFNDVITRTVQEGRVGGIVSPGDPSKVEDIGTRWVINPLDYYLAAPARRALEYVFDLDPSNQGREQKIESTTEAMEKGNFISEKEKKYYQKIAPSMFFLPTSFSSGSVKGATTDANGRVLQENTKSDGAEIKDWGDFAKRFSMAPEDGSKPPFFMRDYVVRLAAYNTASSVAAATSQIPSDGGALPRLAADASPKPTDNSMNNIIMTSGVMEQVQKDLKQDAREKTLSLNTSLTGNPSMKNPDTALARPYGTQKELEKQISYADETDKGAAASGRNNELVNNAGTQEQNRDLVSQGMERNIQEQISNQMNNQLAQRQGLQNFFGNSLPGMQNLFGNDLGSSPWNNFSPPGGDSGSGGGGSGSDGTADPDQVKTINDIPRNSNPASAACSASQRALSENEAIAAAILIRLPYSSTKSGTALNTYYVSRSEVVGKVPLNGGYIQEEDLPANMSCIWVVTYEEGDTLYVAVIEDTQEQNGGKILTSI